MALDLRLAAAQRDEHREGQQLALPRIEPRAGLVVAEAVGREGALQGEQVGGRSFIHAVDGLAEERLLEGEPLFEPLVTGDGRTALERERDAPSDQQPVLEAEQPLDPCEADVGGGVVEHLLDHLG